MKQANNIGTIKTQISFGNYFSRKCVQELNDHNKVDFSKMFPYKCNIF